MDCTPSGIGSLELGGQGKMNVGCEEILQGELHICVCCTPRTPVSTTTVGLPLLLQHQCSLHAPTCNTTIHHAKTVSYSHPSDLLDAHLDIVHQMLSILKFSHDRSSLKG